MKEKVINKILYKERTLNYDYPGERNFSHANKIYFNRDINLLLRRENKFGDIYYEEELLLKRNDKLKIKKDTFITYKNLLSGHRVWSLRFNFKILRERIYKILLYFIYLSTFILGALGKFSDFFGYKNDYLFMIMFLGSIFTWLIFTFIPKFIKIIDSLKLKKEFRKEGFTHFIQITKEKNGEPKNRTMQGKILYCDKIFRKIRFDFGRSWSNFRNIKFNKNNRDFKYEYFQKFRNPEPDELYKKGEGTYRIGGEKIIYSTIDHTRTKGEIILLKTKM